jgi:hypothetical protein
VNPEKHNAVSSFYLHPSTEGIGLYGNAGALVSVPIRGLARLAAVFSRLLRAFASRNVVFLDSGTHLPRHTFVFPHSCAHWRAWVLFFLGSCTHLLRELLYFSTPGHPGTDIPVYFSTPGHTGTDIPVYFLTPARTVAAGCCSFSAPARIYVKKCCISRLPDTLAQTYLCISRLPCAVARLAAILSRLLCAFAARNVVFLDSRTHWHRHICVFLDSRTHWHRHTYVFLNSRAHWHSWLLFFLNCCAHLRRDILFPATPACTGTGIPVYGSALTHAGDVGCILRQTPKVTDLCISRYAILVERAVAWQTCCKCNAQATCVFFPRNTQTSREEYANCSVSVTWPEMAKYFYARSNEICRVSKPIKFTNSFCRHKSTISCMQH